MRHSSRLLRLAAFLILPVTGFLNAADKSGVEVENWGKTPDGQEISLYTFSNKNGLTVKMTNYGAIVVSVETPDRKGKLTNINAGFDNLDSYLAGHPYFGSTVGRFCNRIANGKFSIGKKQYTLAQNDGDHHLHGGEKGYDKVVWTGTPVKRAGAKGVEFSYLSEDGEEGYPGNLAIKATYLLTNKNELVVQLQAETDAATPVNLTNHNYWNLGGVGSGTIHNHLLKVEADKSLDVDAGLIPTGKFNDVAGTPLDFRKFHKIGLRIEENTLDPNGYDHCFSLRNQKGKMALAATVKEPKSGRVMKIYTDQIGLQFYSGNFLSGDESSGGNDYQTLFCLETQHYPNSPNIKSFPTTILKPGQKYHHVTVHAFSVED
ncbi:MAG: galactose-1-epimerase [Planctomycetaceae bacterium]|nr:galactose-1-epimerase [Planctomycetaceae bacterium]|tara:strand:+ start:5725 stop:6849 length:1125 start_codon:yes stop_codon:yes gene_type:complete